MGADELFFGNQGDVMQLCEAKTGQWIGLGHTIVDLNFGKFLNGTINNHRTCAKTERRFYARDHTRTTYIALQEVPEQCAGLGQLLQSFPGQLVGLGNDWLGGQPQHKLLQHQTRPERSRFRMLEHPTMECTFAAEKSKHGWFALPFVAVPLTSIKRRALTFDALPCPGHSATGHGGRREFSIVFALPISFSFRIGYTRTTVERVLEILSHTPSQDFRRRVRAMQRFRGILSGMNVDFRHETNKNRRKNLAYMEIRLVRSPAHSRRVQGHKSGRLSNRPENGFEFSCCSVFLDGEVKCLNLLISILEAIGRCNYYGNTPKPATGC